MPPSPSREQLTTAGIPGAGPALARQLWRKAGRELRAHPSGFVLPVGEGRQLSLPAAAGASIILRGMQRNNQSPGASREGFCACVGRKGDRQRFGKRDSRRQGRTPRHAPNTSSRARSLHGWPHVCTALTVRRAPDYPADARAGTGTRVEPWERRRLPDGRARQSCLLDLLAWLCLPSFFAGARLLSPSSQTGRGVPALPGREGTTRTQGFCRAGGRQDCLKSVGLGSGSQGLGPLGSASPMEGGSQLPEAVPSHGEA